MSSPSIALRVCGPAVAALSRVRYGAKFAFVGALVAVPLVYISVAYLGAERERLDFNSAELDGIAAMDPMFHVLLASVDARSAAAGTIPPSDRLPMASVVEAATIAIDEELPAVAPRWADLAARLESTDPADADAWDRNVADVREMIVAIGDASNMTLDPELDSYYLMDAVQFRLPRIVDVVSAAADEVGGGGPLSMESEARAFGSLSIATDQLRTLGAGMATVDAEIGIGAFGVEWFARLDAEIEPFLDDLRSGEAERFDTGAIGLAWHEAAEAFHDVVDHRVDALRRRALVVLTVSLLTIVGAAYVSISLYLALTRPVRSVLTTLTRVGEGDLASRVEVGGRDELADIAKQINATVAAVEASARQLDAKATHDALTGLPNRTLILQRVTEALDRARFRDEYVAVCFIDLDRFKMINDSLGHEAGDLVLKEVSSRLLQAARPQDVVGRLAGDEFVVLCEHIASPDEAIDVAERILELLEEPVAVRLRTATHRLGSNASVGLAVVDPGRTLNADMALRNADLAMYEAKRRGRGQLVVFEDEMQRQAQRRLEVHEELSDGIERGEVVPHYQPLVSMGTGCVVGFESLARWQHPARGLLAPASFLPEAEESGLIERLGLVVMEQACARTVAWRAVDHRLRTSVNVSARQLSDRRLPDRIAAVLASTGLAPSALVVELTESAVMDDAEKCVAVMQAIKELGVKLAIDDFGTGFSSLSYLARMPVDIVKIDRSFVDGLGGPSHAEYFAIVNAVVNLARGFGLHVTAEGVERPEHVSVLAGLGVDTLQGYLLGRPTDAAGATGLIGRRLLEVPSGVG